MPLYEYECEACAHRFERIQKFSDPPVEACPKCGSKVRKLISSPAIQFKGSGFYITDYPKSGSDRGGSGKSEGKSGDAKSGDSKSSDSKSSDSKSSDSASATKTESKPEAKSESKA